MKLIKKYPELYEGSSVYFPEAYKNFVVGHMFVIEKYYPETDTVDFYDSDILSDALRADMKNVPFDRFVVLENEDTCNFRKGVLESAEAFAALFKSGDLSEENVNKTIKNLLLKV